MSSCSSSPTPLMRWKRWAEALSASPSLPPAPGSASSSPIPAAVSRNRNMFSSLSTPPNPSGRELAWASARATALFSNMKARFPRTIVPRAARPSSFFCRPLATQTWLPRNPRFPPCRRSNETPATPSHLSFTRCGPLLPSPGRRRCRQTFLCIDHVRRQLALPAPLPRPSRRSRELHPGLRSSALVLEAECCRTRFHAGIAVVLATLRLAAAFYRSQSGFRRFLVSSCTGLLSFRAGFAPSFHFRRPGSPRTPPRLHPAGSLVVLSLRLLQPSLAIRDRRFFQIQSVLLFPRLHPASRDHCGFGHFVVKKPRRLAASLRPSIHCLHSHRQRQFASQRGD